MAISQRVDALGGAEAPFLPARRTSWARAALFATISFAGAGLLFVVQPLVAKLILPLVALPLAIPSDGPLGGCSPDRPEPGPVLLPGGQRRHDQDHGRRRSPWPRGRRPGFLRPDRSRRFQLRLDSRAPADRGSHPDLRRPAEPRWSARGAQQQPDVQPRARPRQRGGQSRARRGSGLRQHGQGRAIESVWVALGPDTAVERLRERPAWAELGPRQVRWTDDYSSILSVFR